jgi:hypothetical protein
MSECLLHKENFVSGTDVVSTKDDLIVGLPNIFICCTPGTYNIK